MAIRIQLRRNTLAYWTAVNPLPLAGEEIYETDTRNRKVGDGVTLYNALPYDATAGGGITDGTKGDVVVSSAGTVWALSTAAKAALPISTAQASAIATKLAASDLKTINGQAINGTGDMVIAGGSGASATRIASTPAIPLDTAGNGKVMPLTAGQTISITADITPTIAAGAVLDGVCVADYLSSGAGNLLLTNFLARGDTFAVEAGRYFTVTYMNRTSGKYAIVQKGELAPILAPNAATLVVGAIAQTSQGFTITPGAVDSTHNPADTYQVYFSADGGTTYTAFGTPNSTLSRTVTGLTAGTSYKYKVNAINAGGSIFSAVITQSTASAGRTDTFARADESPLNIPSDGGSAWIGTGQQNAMILFGNTARSSTLVYQNSESALLFTSPNMTVTGTVTFSSGTYACMVVRATDVDHKAVEMFASQGGTIGFSYRNGSSGVALMADVTRAAFVVGTAYVMQLSIVGTTFTFKIDGTTIATGTAGTNNATAMYGGIGGTNDGAGMAVKWTDFSIT